MILKSNKIKVLSVISVIAFSVLLGGCGKKEDPELEAYKEAMTDFYDQLTYYNNSINSINPDSDSAKAELLQYLDQMNDSYKVMAQTQIPDEFSGISDIAVEAADYMEKADEFYHMAYDNEFDNDSEMLAAQYYQRANSRVLVMLQVLHGQVPEGEGISVETESTYEFSTIDSDSESESEGEAETESGAESNGE